MHKKREKKFKNKKERNSDASQDQLGRLNKKIQPKEKKKVLECHSTRDDPIVKQFDLLMI